MRSTEALELLSGFLGLHKKPQEATFGPEHSCEATKTQLCSD